MARNKQKRINKIRKYRDKLLTRITDLEAFIRGYKITLIDIRAALHDNNVLRAAALSTMDADALEDVDKFRETNELASELALVYRMLIVERQYAVDILKAANQRDYLRTAALCSSYKDEIAAHEKMLNEWSQEHGFTRSLRRSITNEDVA